MWAAQNVRLDRTGVKSFHHPVVGDFELTFQAMQLPADEGLTLIAYSAEPGTPAYDALNLSGLSATVRNETSTTAQDVSAQHRRV